MIVKKKQKVIVGMSGGVDSSVVAAILKKQGYDVTGVFMQFWFPSSSHSETTADSSEKIKSSHGEINAKNYEENRCCSLESWHEAKKVAEIIGIPIYKMNFGREFKQAIVDEFLSAYKNGLTPNPCVACNKFIKFDLLWHKAKAVFDADFLSTGHYVNLNKCPPARLARPKNGEGGRQGVGGSRYKLLRAKDKTKDQTYFLYNLKQKDLTHLLFPLGGYQKTEVRKMALDLGLPVHNKKDSQEICFVGSSHYDFLKKYLKLKPGIIITHDSAEGKADFLPLYKGSKTGRSETSPLDAVECRQMRPKEAFGSAQERTKRGYRELGRHFGLPLYTIGQREGLGLSNGPWYVCGFNRRKNILIVTKDQDNSDIFQNELKVSEINWLSSAPKMPLKCLAQIRYHSKPANCVVKKNGKFLSVEFKQKQRAIMPGQSVVFYKGDELLGGGIIA